MDTSTLGFDVVVMCTGIILVFLILVLLMFIITLEGKFFDAKANGKKKGNDAMQKATETAKGPAVQPVAPVVEKGIPEAVVAVIAAAIAAISGGRYKLRAVRRAASNWGRAGVSDVTSPF
jgi:sodium pump decarboxylase gamma subunit